MDDRQQFAAERADRLNKLAETPGPLPEAKAFFEASLPLLYSYNFEWLGLPIIQYPQDVMAIQEIVWRTRPDLIIETGIARGGSHPLRVLVEVIGNVVRRRRPTRHQPQTVSRSRASAAMRCISSRVVID